MNEPRFSPDLRDRLVELFGPDGALELMERVPEVQWHEIATKADVADLVTKADLGATKADIVGVKADIVAVKADLSGVKADLSAVKVDIGVLRGDVLSTKLELAEFRVEMANQFREFSFRMTTTMVTTMLGGIFGAAGLAFAAAKLS